MKKICVIFLLLTLYLSNVNATVLIGSSFNRMVKCSIVDAEVNKYKIVINYVDQNFNAIPEDPVLMLKLMDDSVLELKGNRTRSDVTTQGIGVLQTHSDEATFIINQNEFDKIIQGVKKIRINTHPNAYEKEWKNGKFGKKFYKDYQKSRF